MKRLAFITLVLILTTSLYSQVPSSSWNLSLGGSMPTFFSSDVTALGKNYGGFLSFQRNFTEFVGLRISGHYSHLTGLIPGGIYFHKSGAPATGSEEMYTDIIRASADFLYYLTPCYSVSPYLFLGAGGAYYKPDWGSVVNDIAEDKINFIYNFGIGCEWEFGKVVKLKTEAAYHTMESRIDGIDNNNRQGIFGSNTDSFIEFNLGFVFYFSRSKPSKYCKSLEGVKVDLPENLSTLTRRDVEDIVRRHIPKEVIKEVVVEKEVPQPVSVPKENIVLTGIKFRSGSSRITMESYHLLDRAYVYLTDNPTLIVEIQGHTDNTGSASINQRISEERARSVLEYLVRKGIARHRMRAVGFGELKPIVPNATAEGRALNRRIEFKVMN